MSLTKQVTQKLDEFGLYILDEHALESESDYVFYLEEMIVFINEADNSISVTFKATTRPERSATLALILNQIKEVDMHVMEPFMFNSKNEFLSGEKAYEEIKSFYSERFSQELQKQQFYSDILERADCHEC